MSKKAQVLFIYKKSAYQQHVRERKNKLIKRLIAENDRTVRNYLAADEAHLSTIEEAKEACRQLGVRGAFRYRSDEGLVEGFELVVTIGGDGTLLWVSHRVPPKVPVLAVNSAPEHSVGHFCGGRKGRVKLALAAALDGRLRRTRLSRMQVEVDETIVHKRVLNDALFCHRSPAATTRYILEANGTEESQKSSGMWIGPSAGSTAAQRSAGGKVLAPGSRKLQFVVREPYHPPEGAYRLRRGLIAAGEALTIYSKIREGRIYLDGPHVRHEVTFGTRVVFSRSDQPLSLLAFPRANR